MYMLHIYHMYLIMHLVIHGQRRNVIYIYKIISYVWHTCKMYIKYILLTWDTYSSLVCYVQLLSCGNARNCYEYQNNNGIMNGISFELFTGRHLRVYYYKKIMINQKHLPTNNGRSGRLTIIRTRKRAKAETSQRNLKITKRQKPE